MLAGLARLRSAGRPGVASALRATAQVASLLAFKIPVGLLLVVLWYHWVLPVADAAAHNAAGYSMWALRAFLALLLRIVLWFE